MRAILGNINVLVLPEQLAIARAHEAFAEDEIQEAPWGRWKTFTDPDGNGWVLQQDSPGFAP